MKQFSDDLLNLPYFLDKKTKTSWTTTQSQKRWSVAVLALEFYSPWLVEFIEIEASSLLMGHVTQLQYGYRIWQS